MQRPDGMWSAFSVFIIVAQPNKHFTKKKITNCTAKQLRLTILPICLETKRRVLVFKNETGILQGRG